MRSIVGRNQETTRSNVFCVVSEALAPTIRRDLRDVRKDRVEVELSANSTSSGHWFEPNSAPTSGKPAPAALLIQTNAVPRQNGHFVVTPRATNPHDSGSSPGGPISTRVATRFASTMRCCSCDMCPCCNSVLSPVLSSGIARQACRERSTGDPQLANSPAGWSRRITDGRGRGSKPSAARSVVEVGRCRSS